MFSKESEDKTEVGWRTYFTFLKYTKNWFLICLVLVFFAASEVCFTLFTNKIGSYDTAADDYGNLFLVSGIFLGVFLILIVFKYFLVAYIVNRGNRNLHHEMVEKLSRAPVSYFDKTPVGRIVNRFSNDMGIMDLTMFYFLIDSIDGPI